VLPACGVYISQLIRYSRACSSYQYFLDMVAANKDATKPRVTIGLVTWLALRNICVTNDHGYVRFNVMIIRSFPPHSWLVFWFVTRVTRWVPHMKLKLLILLEFFEFFPPFYLSLWVWVVHAVKLHVYSTMLQCPLRVWRINDVHSIV
jgi:hypothetical protein